MTTYCANHEEHCPQPCSGCEADCPSEALYESEEEA